MSQINNTTPRRYSSSNETLWHCHLKMYFVLGLLTCSLLHCVHADAGVNNARFVYNKSNTDATANAESTDTSVKLLDESEADTVPMEFYRRLNNITDITEFIEKFIDPDSIDPQLGIHENLRRPVERAAVVRAEVVKCKVEPTVVDLKAMDPTNIYYPSCTRVKRCTGCCNTHWMSCQPTQTETVNFQIFRFCHGKTKPGFCGFEVVPMEVHLDCKCDCRIKPEHCNSYQFHQDCRCHCKNDDARSKCLNLENKIWDNKNCTCVCKQNENCTTGSYYDQNQCRCLLLNANPHGNVDDIAIPPIVNNRRRFFVKPIEVDPDNSTIYKV